MGVAAWARAVMPCRCRSGGRVGFGRCGTPTGLDRGPARILTIQLSNGAAGCRFCSNSKKKRIQLSSGSALARTAAPLSFLRKKLYVRQPLLNGYGTIYRRHTAEWIPTGFTTAQGFLSWQYGPNGIRSNRPNLIQLVQIKKNKKQTLPLSCSSFSLVWIWLLASSISLLYSS